MENKNVIKRNGTEAEYDGNKILEAIVNAMKEKNNGKANYFEAGKLSAAIDQKTYDGITIEKIQDIVIAELIKYDGKLATLYASHRERHRILREEGTRVVYLDAVDTYMNQSNWRTKENSNAHYSYGALNKFIVENTSKDYWLDRVYPKNIKDASDSGDFHIHDLGGLTIYCCGYSLKDLINKGIRGVSNIPVSAPAKHFASILAQLANITTIFQNEIMGAVAFSNFDTLLAPFVKIDGLTYREVYQQLQAFIYQINSNSRSGAEPAFSNLTIDLSPDKDMAPRKAVIANKEMDFTYGDCQEEMNIINKAFWSILLKGDAEGKTFAYPIPTVNIHKEFDWDNSELDVLWELTGKFGVPYFANFINTDMEPEDARSMCCRLRLSIREIQKKTGGLFGAGEKTGSIGVVTLNMPRYGLLSKSEEELFKTIGDNMDLVRESLDIKRDFLEEQLKRGLLPAFEEYVGNLDSHFSTIGYLGLNEMCVNFFGNEELGIVTTDGYELAFKVLTFMNEKIADYQEDGDALWNLEASPAESTCYKLAKKDVDLFGENIFTQGTDEPYYTNSCHMPVKDLTTIDALYTHQHELQALHSGGTVIHNYLKGSISGEQAKAIVRYTTEQYKAPYTSLSPIYSICPKHGYLDGLVDNCPTCGIEVESFQRITGYTRPVSKFNVGKAEEFKDRNQMSGDISEV